MNLYADILRPCLFQFEPETAHHLALTGLRLTPAPVLRAMFGSPAEKPVRLFGVTFPNPVGLAAELAGQAWVRIEAVVALAERITSSLRERAITEGGLPLPGGDRLAPVAVSRSTIDPEVALPILRGLVGDRADALVLVERKIENTAIDRVATELARASGEKIKDHKDRLWKALEPALSRSSYTQLKVRK